MFAKYHYNAYQELVGQKKMFIYYTCSANIPMVASPIHEWSE